MNYWPMSIIRNSALMPAHHIWEIARIPQTYHLSWQTFNACCAVAKETQHVNAPSLTIVDSVGAPPKQIYLDKPGREEWDRLERCAVVQDGDGEMHIIIDLLH